ncbi:hypothetical protein EJB05_04177 [Eragrostis curvula]|uniref:FMN hydroxy acid dehydrogenase domain-containing protein n=1 Tax=Eragrostis curvula TaxID=38414 RepID=A0A5J9WA12_9POAL|nr:hypothetical protein EJB05_04177 [Eragrostis curvula]
MGGDHQHHGVPGHREQKLPKMVYDYYASGAEDEWTLKENREAFSGSCEYATARASSAAGTIMTLSSWATSSVEEVASTGPGIRFFQLYVYKDRKVVEQLVRRAERAGFKAIALTVDTPRLGRREADIKNRFVLPPHLTLKNFEGLDLGKMDQVCAGFGVIADLRQVVARASLDCRMVNGSDHMQRRWEVVVDGAGVGGGPASRNCLPDAEGGVRASPWRSAGARPSPEIPRST